jgi:hypothetical protein
MMSAAEESAAFAYGSGRSSVACTTANSAVGAAIPRASAPTAVARNEGWRNNERSAARNWNMAKTLPPAEATIRSEAIKVEPDYLA